MVTVLWPPSQNLPFGLSSLSSLVFYGKLGGKKYPYSSISEWILVDPGEVPGRKSLTPKLLSRGWTVPLTRKGGGGGGNRERRGSWQPFPTP